MLKHALLFPALSASSGVGFFSFSVLSRPDCRLPSIVRCVSEPGGSTELAGSVAHGRRARGEEGLPQPAGVGGRFHPQGLLRLLKQRLRGRGGHHLPRGVAGGGAWRLHFPPRLRWSARSAFVLNILGSALGQVHSLICRPSACTPGGASFHSDSKMIFFMSAFCLQEKITNGPSPIFFIVIFYPFIIYYYFNGVQEGWAFKQMNLAYRLELEAPNLKRLC